MLSHFQLIDRGFVGQPKYPYSLLLKKKLPEDVDDMHKEVSVDLKLLLCFREHVHVRVCMCICVFSFFFNIFQAFIEPTQLPKTLQECSWNVYNVLWTFPGCSYNVLLASIEA